MANPIQAEIVETPTGKELVLHFPINNPLIPSRSGYAYIIASTEENWQETTAVVNGQKVAINRFYATIRRKGG